MAERTDFYGSNTPKCRKSPCSFQKTGCSFHSFVPILSKRAKKKSPENRLFTGLFGGELGIRTLGPFRDTAFRVLHLRPLGQLSVYVIPHFFQKLLERTDGKNNKIFNFRTGENPEFMGFLSGANSQLYKKFRVSPVMTTSIPLRIYPRIFARIRLYHKRNHLSRKNKVNLRQNQGFRLKYNLIQAFLCAKV